MHNIFNLNGKLLKLCGIFLFYFLMSTNTSNGQIINVESLRKTTDTSKWSGTASLDITLIKNTRDIFRIANRVHVQYNNKQHLVLFVNNLNFQKIDDNSFINQGTQHLRYNYRLGERIKLEAFLQGQYDAISELDFRGLAGLGPRFKLSKDDNYRVYLGILVMYEYEKASEAEFNNINRDIRGSTYLSFSLYPKENVSIVSTTYYQPKLSEFRDYRISSETSLAFSIFRNLSFVSRFSWFYDAEPIADTPRTQYQLTNGIAYSFD